MSGEHLGVRAGLSEGDNPLQLCDVAALLRKGDDPNAVLKGLAALGPLVDAAPHELESHAGESFWSLINGFDSTLGMWHPCAEES